MSNTGDLLLEIGTEDLPPKSLQSLAQDFAAGVEEGLREANLPPQSVDVFATPRRIAARVNQVPKIQPNSCIERRGPALKFAYDADGQPTKAAKGFAKSCGVGFEQLSTLETDKGSWLTYTARQKGHPVVDLIEGIIIQVLNKLPIEKRMRWGGGSIEFVRPVHWICALLDEEAITCKVLGHTARAYTYGHRFHAGQALSVTAENYPRILRDQGKVIVDFEERKQAIVNQIERCASSQSVEAVIDDDLLSEVTALVEWPVAVVGRFDEDFLSMPEEVLITSMQDHQKYFPMRDSNGKLIAQFITVSNIESHHPETVRLGNERVIRPRLADAMFFWQQDRKKPLSSYQTNLSAVLFQKRLGSMADKSVRVARIATYIAKKFNVDVAMTQRAAALAKCDLLTNMVGEFPSLQGVMGEYYAKHDGEPVEVARALREQYLPRFSSDGLPQTPIGSALAIAERVDILLGIFAIGQKPNGVKDPYALRRSALGVLRIMLCVEARIDLLELLHFSSQGFEASLNAAAIVDDLFDFMMERLRSYYMDASYNDKTPVSMPVFEAVLSYRPTDLVDFDKRINAVCTFECLPEAVSLASANKRISNILKKSYFIADNAQVDQVLLLEPQEKVLYERIDVCRQQTRPLYQSGDYVGYLCGLAALHQPLDDFFDAVMVMVDDEARRKNRLALLKSVLLLFSQVADISRLSNA